MEEQEQSLKEKFMHEMRVYCVYSIYLALFFCSMITYQRLILEEYSISYFHYSYGIFQALVLAKIIVIGETFGLGEKLKDRPLIFPTLYKAVVFSFFVFLLTVIEHFLAGYLHGLHFAEIYQKFIGEGVNQILAKVLVVFFAFIPFFAFVETARVLGEGKFVNLFFFRKTG